MPPRPKDSALSSLKATANVRLNREQDREPLPKRSEAPSSQVGKLHISHCALMLEQPSQSTMLEKLENSEITSYAKYNKSPTLFALIPQSPFYPFLLAVSPSQQGNDHSSHVSFQQNLPRQLSGLQLRIFLSILSSLLRCQRNLLCPFKFLCYIQTNPPCLDS